MALFKILLSGILIWAASELGKRSGRLGGLVLSLPLTSIAVILWLWFETKDPSKVASISTETLIFVLPSLIFFVALSYLLNRSMHFYAAFGISIFVTLGAYAAFFKLRA